MGEGFLDYLVEQDFLRDLAVVGAVAGAYAGIVLLAAGLTCRWLEPGLRRAGTTGTCAALAAFAVGLTLFEAVALYHRHAPPGSGALRQGASLERFYTAATVGLVLVYATVASTAAITAALAARRGRAHAAPAAALALALVAVFFVATLPLVEFQNACYVGRPLLIDVEARC